MANSPSPTSGSTASDPPQKTVALDPAAAKSTELDSESATLAGDIVSNYLQDAPVSVGDKIGKYQVRAKLGSGGMGAVYLAFDPMIEREVALKVLSPQLSNSPTALQRFLGEARAIGRLNHPHVVSIYEIDQWNERYFLVMELLAGGSVADRVDEAGAIAWQEACRLTAEAARGLAAAHSAGMVHRDIKPENLMLTKDLAVKVVDFGLSKLLDASQDPQQAVTKAGQIMGTPQYMSPEQFESSNVDFRTDIYSLGATLFRLLTGRFPYQDSQTIMQVMTSHMTKPPPKPTEFAQDIPAELNHIVARAMAKELADRYQTMDEFAAELEQLLNVLPSSADVTPVAVRPLLNAVVLEPSRLQGAIWKDALSRAGATIVPLVSTLAAAQQAVSADVPDAIVTAMELPDGRGIDLLRDLGRRSLLKQATVVLNSSDSTLDELQAIGSAACLILAPKKARPDDVLGVIHAASPCRISSGPLSEKIDPLSLRLRICADSGRIPEDLAAAIREVGLLDVDVQAVKSATSSPADLTLVIRDGGRAGGDGPDGLGMTAVVDVSQNRVVMQKVRRQNVVALCDCRLDADRLIRLLQGCRP